MLEKVKRDIETDTDNPVTDRNIILASILGGLLGILLVMAILLGFWVRHRKRFPPKGSSEERESIYNHYAASRTPSPVRFPPPLLEQQAMPLRSVSHPKPFNTAAPKAPPKSPPKSPKSPRSSKSPKSAKSSPRSPTKHRRKSSPTKSHRKSGSPRKSVSSSIYIQSRPLPGAPRQAPPVPTAEPFMKDPLSHSFVSAANQHQPPVAPPSLVASMSKRDSSSTVSILKSSRRQTLKQSLNSVIHESLGEDLPRNLPQLSPDEIKHHQQLPESPEATVAVSPRPSQTNMGDKLKSLLGLSSRKRNLPDQQLVTSTRRISLPSPEFKKTWTTYDPAPKIDFTLDGASSIYLPDTNSSSSLGSRSRTPVHAIRVGGPQTPPDKVITTPPMPAAPGQATLRTSSESEDNPPTLSSSSTHETSRNLQPSSSNGGTATDAVSVQSLLGTRLSVCIESGLSWLSEFHKFESMSSAVVSPLHTPKMSSQSFQVAPPDLPGQLPILSSGTDSDNAIVAPKRSQRQSRPKLSLPSLPAGLPVELPAGLPGTSLPSPPIAVPPKASTRLPSVRISHVCSEMPSHPRLSVTEAPPSIDAHAPSILSPRYGHTRVDSAQTYVEDHRAYANEPEQYTIGGDLLTPTQVTPAVDSLSVPTDNHHQPQSLIDSDCEFDFDQGESQYAPPATGSFVHDSRPISVSSSVFDDDYTVEDDGRTFADLQRQYRESGINLRQNSALDYVRETEELLESLRSSNPPSDSILCPSRRVQSHSSSDTLRLGPIPSNNDVRPLRISKQPSRAASLQPPSRF